MAKEYPETIFYTDPLHDEFGQMDVHADPIDENYSYIRDNGFFGRLKRFFLFRVIAKPIAWFYLHNELHHEIVGRWKLKRYRKQAIFIYGNHTQPIGDALMPAFILSPRYINVIVHPDNLVVPGVGKYVPLLGGLPLPHSAKAKENFTAAIGKRVSQHQPIVIYPEAHIWPFYTGIRPFGNESFTYPVYYGAPVFCFTNTYHKLKNGKVRIRTYVDGPFFPAIGASPKEACEQLRNEVYNTMTERASTSTYEKIKYVRKEKENG